MGDCLNCPLKIRVEQIETRQEKFETKVEQLSESNQKNEIWQARADLKFEHIITSLESVQTNIQSITDKPIKRLDAVTLAGIVAVVTAFINIAIKVMLEILKT